MPIYKYECESCAHVFEDLRGINDPNPDQCPACAHQSVRRLVSAGNFHLKGSGWYVTDYGSSGAEAEGDSQTAEETSSGADSGSEKVAVQDSSTDSADGTEAA